MEHWWNNIGWEKLKYPEKLVPLRLPLIQHGLARISTMTSVSVKPSNIESLYTAVSGLDDYE